MQTYPLSFSIPRSCARNGCAAQVERIAAPQDGVLVFFCTPHGVEWDGELREAMQEAFGVTDVLLT